MTAARLDAEHRIRRGGHSPGPAPGSSGGGQ
jgi:hypothetical protein